MKQPNTPGGGLRGGRRTVGRAQENPARDPYAHQGKLKQGSTCPQCGVVFADGRWQWMSAPAEAERTQLCPACRRINDGYPAGLVTLSGGFVARHKTELLRLARNQEQAERGAHPMNRIMAIEGEGDTLILKTTDIHLPHRIGEAVKSAYDGELCEAFEHGEYFVRVTWRRED